MKALGYSNGAILAHYLLLAALVAAVGVLLGCLLGSWLSYGLARVYAMFFNFPYLIYNISWNTYLISGLFGFGAATAGAFRAALSAARLAPATAMSPPAPPRYKRNWFDRFLDTIRVSQPTMMILRSLIRWPLRAAMSAIPSALMAARNSQR